MQEVKEKPTEDDDGRGGGWGWGRRSHLLTSSAKRTARREAEHRLDGDEKAKEELAY